MEVEIDEVPLASVEERDVVHQTGVVGAIVDRHGDGEVFLSAEIDDEEENFQLLCKSHNIAKGNSIFSINEWPCD